MDLPTGWSEAQRLLDGRLKIRHLRLVDAIASCGTVAAAAVELQTSQPVVSRGLQELEAILGTALFVRGPRGVAPTPAGLTFLDHARSILTQLTAAAVDVDDLAHGRAGTVAVGTHLAGTNILLPQALRTYKEERPSVTVIVREGTPSSLTTSLLAGELDLVVGRLVPSAERDVLMQVPLYREPVRLVVGRQHPCADSSQLTLAELFDYPWILPDEQTALRRELEQVFLNAGLDVPANRVECTSILTVRMLLTQAPYVAALPQLIAVDDDELRVLDTELVGVSRTVGVTRRRQSYLSVQAREFHQHLEVAAGAMRRTLNLGPSQILKSQPAASS